MRPFASIFVLLFLAAPTLAQPSNSVVPVVVPLSSFSGVKTAAGIRLIVQVTDHSFSVELAGKAIRPTGKDRLAWDIDGMAIEVQAAIFPRGTGGGLSGRELLEAYERWDRNRGQRDGWLPQGEAQPNACPAPDQCLVWTRHKQSPPAFLFATATIVKDVVLVIAATASDSTQEDKLREFLRTSIASIREEAPPAQAKREPAPRDPMNDGATLEQALQLDQLLTGERFAAFLNSDLMTSKDSKLRNVVAVDRATLLEAARFFLATSAHVMASSMVFDGASSHAINLQAVRDSDIFEYFDPWGKGSFLAAANNKAGVDAQPDPTHPRIWLVKGSELERVLYSFAMPERYLVDVIRLATLLHGSGQSLSSGLADMRTADPKDPFLEEDKLSHTADYLLQRQSYDEAIALYEAIAALYPDSAKAKEAVATAYRIAGRSMPAAASGAPAGDQPAPILLADAVQTDFFKFFHLQKEGAEPDAQTGGNFVIFKPQAEQFHALAMVLVRTNKSDEVLSRQLVLSRQFVDSPRLAAFARDLAKSYLLDAVFPDERAEIAGLASEIWNVGRSATVPVPAALRPNTRLPRFPSPAYQVFRNERESYRQDLKHNVMMLRNIKEGDSAALTIVFQMRAQ